MFKVTTNHIITDEEGLVKAYFLNEIPFTYDTMDDDSITDELMAQACKNPTLSVSLIHQKSAYLLEEGLHPLLSGIELDPSSILPDIK
tara:strand:+ start:1005 stop:1268 length:264 start_codon:yes stop_codon:yes gene_type:complete